MGSSEFLTTRQLADYLGMSIVKINNDRARGFGPPYMRVDRVIRYRRTDVDEWIKEHTITPQKR